MFLISCNVQDQVTIEYEYEVQEILPDSNKLKMAKWITETVSASNHQMTGGDYEDPEDVIEELQDVGEDLFSVKVEGLKRIKKRSGQVVDFYFIPKSELTPEQLKIFSTIRN
jgi:hypothetical protein